MIKKYIFVGFIGLAFFLLADRLYFLLVDPAKPTVKQGVTAFYPLLNNLKESNGRAQNLLYQPIPHFSLDGIDLKGSKEGQLTLSDMRKIAKGRSFSLGFTVKPLTSKYNRSWRYNSIPDEDYFSIVWTGNIANSQHPLFALGKHGSDFFFGSTNSRTDGIQFEFPWEPTERLNILFTFNRSQKRSILYINGEKIVENRLQGFVKLPKQLILGGGFTPEIVLIGNYSQLAVWSRELSPEEAKSEHEGRTQWRNFAGVGLTIYRFFLVLLITLAMWMGEKRGLFKSLSDKLVLLKKRVNVFFLDHLF